MSGVAWELRKSTKDLEESRHWRAELAKQVLPEFTMPAGGRMGNWVSSSREVFVFFRPIGAGRDGGRSGGAVLGSESRLLRFFVDSAVENLKGHKRLELQAEFQHGQHGQHGPGQRTPHHAQTTSPNPPGNLRHHSWCRLGLRQADVLRHVHGNEPFTRCRISYLCGTIRESATFRGGRGRTTGNAAHRVQLVPGGQLV